ncbi:MAG: peptide antibiotic transporter SbmA [Cereibacter sphaeroides]|uniref:Peptide antibiotic transporter SbmA n=1 Tax=Cereibacter sphaeroides TaxID=1063 RepID=A0A2W5SFT8_CERSP|nr:MAG: peptide antibiotic transporter SbmA [Cereibacter sphaeroides]
MFKSFFPRPKLLLITTLVWVTLAVAIWYTVGEDFGARFGMPSADPNAPPVLGLGHFVTPDFLWFYIYCGAFLFVFSAAWFILSPHPYQWWSITGTALILFSTYYSVQVSVALNNWRGPFFDDVQNALSGSGEVTAAQLYGLLLIFAKIALMWVAVYVATRFFVSHYVFRWRQAMNDYYMSRWPEVRKIEGASQRVQEDTMRFATIMEDLGVSVVDSLMTLFAFLPVLAALSAHVSELPVVGSIAQPLLWASVAWSAFGTLLLAIAGIKLPGLNFRNQRVEAAYRKELVYGEDDAARAEPMTVRELFGQVRKNYFRLYFHYAYFNIFRGLYLQTDNIFAYLILIPTIAAGKITFGILQQILTAFGQVSGSFQYLVNSWSTIIELLSIRKRLVAFEAAFEGLPQADIEREHPLTP